MTLRAAQMSKSIGQFLAKEVDRDLRAYCLRHWGKWWATRFFLNSEAKEVYNSIRPHSMAVAIRIVSNNDPDYKKYIQEHSDLVEGIQEMNREIARGTWK